jgi:hypothetical protein
MVCRHAIWREPAIAKLHTTSIGRPASIWPFFISVFPPMKTPPVRRLPPVPGTESGPVPIAIRRNTLRCATTTFAVPSRRRSTAKWTGSVRYRTDGARGAWYGVDCLPGRTQSMKSTRFAHSNEYGIHRHRACSVRRSRDVFGIESSARRAVAALQRDAVGTVESANWRHLRLRVAPMIGNDAAQHLRVGVDPIFRNPIPSGRNNRTLA